MGTFRGVISVQELRQHCFMPASKTLFGCERPNRTHPVVLLSIPGPSMCTPCHVDINVERIRLALFYRSVRSGNLGRHPRRCGPLRTGLDTRCSVADCPLTRFKSRSYQNGNCLGRSSRCSSHGWRFPLTHGFANRQDGFKSGTNSLNPSSKGQSVSDRGYRRAMLGVNIHAGFRREVQQCSQVDELTEARDDIVRTWQIF